MEEKVKLFDPKFVHFMWDDELEGKKCFVGNSVDFLMSVVERNYKSYIVDTIADNIMLESENKVIDPFYF